MAAPVLEVENLTVEFPTDDGIVHAVRGVSFTLEPGEVLGIVGESCQGRPGSAGRPGSRAGPTCSAWTGGRWSGSGARRSP
jgi:ABC-type phosphonate transport system ATPase subunit